MHSRGTQGSFQVDLEIVSGCDGRVSQVWTQNGGGLPERVTACIEETVRQASMPAHDLPDGVTFSYPIVFRFGS